MGAFFELPDPLGKLGRILIELVDPLIELIGSFHQLLRALVQIADLIVIIQISYGILIQVFENGIGDDGHHVLDREIFGSAGDGNGVFQIQVQKILIDIQRVVQSGRGHADHHFFISVIDDLAVIDVDVFKRIIICNEAGHGNKGHGGPVLGPGRITIGNDDLHLSAGPFHIFSLNFLSVQEIRDPQSHRDFIRGGAFIEDIVSLRVPDQGIPFSFFEGLVTFDILDILQCGPVFDLIRTDPVLQVIADRNIGLRTICLRNHIDGLFLCHLLRRPDGWSRRSCQHGKGCKISQYCSA